MLYTKNVNGRPVFSECRVIQDNEGVWISNPSIEQIHSAGWEEYEPPVVPQTEPGLEAVMQAVKKMLDPETEALSDQEALQVAALFPTWASRMNGQVAAGERLWYDGKLYKVIQYHTVHPDWTPDVAPALYTEVSIVEWPQWVQPIGTHDAYMTGDKVTFEGTHYVSLVDNNTWSPADYPQGWEARP